MLKLVSTKTAPEEVYTLYEAAFPVVERRPWPEQLALVEQGKLHLSLLIQSEEFAGFVFFWPLHNFHFIEHFAVSPALRGSGIGTAVMNVLSDSFSRILLEVEPPETGADAERRIRFYERNGFTALPFSWQQPSYHPGGEPLHLILMQKGMDNSAETFARIRYELFEKVYTQVR